MSLTKVDVLHIYCDGGARGNPGPAAVGVVIKNAKGAILSVVAKSIGKATNNTAEYMAVITAYEFLLQNETFPKQIHLYLDSTLVAQQLDGNYKVKEIHLKELYMRTKNLEKTIGAITTYTVIPREQNSAADKLLNDELDRRLIASVK